MQTQYFDRWMSQLLFISSSRGSLVPNCTVFLRSELNWIELDMGFALCWKQPVSFESGSVLRLSDHFIWAWVGLLVWHGVTVGKVVIYGIQPLMKAVSWVKTSSGLYNLLSLFKQCDCWMILLVLDHVWGQLMNFVYIVWQQLHDLGFILFLFCKQYIWSVMLLTIIHLI